MVSSPLFSHLFSLPFLLILYILFLSHSFLCFTFLSLSSNYLICSSCISSPTLSHLSLLFISSTFLSSLYHLLSYSYICRSVILLHVFLICSLHPAAFSTWSPLTSLISLHLQSLSPCSSSLLLLSLSFLHAISCARKWHLFWRDPRSNFSEGDSERFWLSSQTFS